MNIYVLRHGQTDYNLEGKFQGQIDIKMNQNGEKQVAKIALVLNKIFFDVVFSSPLSRTIHTAKRVTNQYIKIDNRIIERSFGDLEGKSSIKNYEEDIKKYKIEPYDELEKRVIEFLQEIITDYKDKENILIVTHEGIAKVINKFFSGEYEKFRLENGKYKKYIIDSK